MKVLIINATCGKGSTGVIAVEIANLLKEKGHTAYIAYGQGSTEYSSAYKIGTSIENKFHALWYSRVLGLEGYGTKLGTKKFIKWVKIINPDIIHIENLHSNFLDFPSFFHFLSIAHIPVVWSLFDCWPYTGKCTHYTEIGCKKWETECCAKCPQLHSSGVNTFFFDRTKKLFNEKKALFNKLESLDIITCSHWLEKEVKKSFLQNNTIHMVYNWIDSSKFQRIEDESVYERYDIDKSKTILLSVSASWGGNTRLIDAINLARILPERFQLVIVGSMLHDVDLPHNIKHISYVDGEMELSKLYSVALAYVNFSVEDTFGKVMAEAELCGTPAIVFNATACPEVVGDAGFVVQPHSVDEMLTKIIEIETIGKEHFSQKSIDYVQSTFNYQKNVSSIIDIYKTIINRSKS